MKLSNSLILVLALTMASCKSVEKSVESVRKVKCESVVAVDSNFDYVNFTGKVVAATDVNLGFRVAGIVEEVCKSDGAFIRKGDVIARLDSRDYAIQLTATEAEYEAIKAEVDRVVALYEDQSVSANDYDKAVNGLKAISAKLNAHKNALSDTELKAPFDGYVQKSNFDKGEAVAAGTPVVSIISATAPEITINIPTPYYVRQKEFESATATFDIYKDEKFNLILKGVSPKSNLNQLYKATFVVEKSEKGTMPIAGMSAMVEVCYSSNQATSLSIPFSSISEDNGVSRVWLIKNGVVNSSEVEVIEIKSDGRALLSGGVVQGDKVVTAGVNSLKEGQKVEILKESSTSNVGGIL